MVAAAVGHPNAENRNYLRIQNLRGAMNSSRARSAGVDKNSQHMQAHAIDIRIPGVDTQALRNAALKMGRGRRRLLSPVAVSCTSTRDECARGVMAEQLSDTNAE